MTASSDEANRGLTTGPGRRRPGGGESPWPRNLAETCAPIHQKKGWRLASPHPCDQTGSLRNRARARAGARVHLARWHQRDIGLAHLAVRRVELHAQCRSAAIAFDHAFVDLADLGLAVAAVVQRQVADRRHVAEV